MLHYTPKNDKDKNDPAIPGCCDEIVIDDPNNCDCCAENWTQHLIIATTNFNEWSARAEKLERFYSSRVEWRDKLKIWYDEMTKADEKADDLVRQIEIFIHHLNKICQITEQTTKAIKYLFCMIEDLYIRVEVLKDAYDDLMTCINSARKTHPELDPAKGVVKCLEEYGKKLIAVTATRDAILKLLTTAIEQIYLLHENLCLREENCGENKPGDYGLINIIMHWRDVLKGKINVNHGKCQFDPFLQFPIDSSEYYHDLKKDWDDLSGEVKNIKIELDAAKKKRDSFQARKTSLVKALAEVSASVTC